MQPKECNLTERTADRLVELERDGAGFDAGDFHDDALVVRVVSPI